MASYRVGRKLGRTIYLQKGSDSADSDVLLGIMDSANFAQYICDVLNECELTYDHDEDRESEASW